MGKFQSGKCLALGKERQPRQRNTGIRFDNRLICQPNITHLPRRADNQSVQSPIGNQQIRPVSHNKGPCAALPGQAHKDHQLLPILRAGQPPGRATNAEGCESVHRHIPLHGQIRQIVPDDFVQLFIPSHILLLQIRFFFPSSAAPIIPAAEPSSALTIRVRRSGSQGMLCWATIRRTGNSSCSSCSLLTPPPMASVSG